MAIRQGSWKLIEAAADGHTLRPDRKPMLFNLADDPAEEHDLAAAQPERVAEMLERLAALRKSRSQSAVRNFGRGANHLPCLAV